MKKLLAIVVLSLLWSDISFAEDKFVGKNVWITGWQLFLLELERTNDLTNWSDDRDHQPNTDYIQDG